MDHNPDKIIDKLKTTESLMAQELGLELSCKVKRQVLDEFTEKEQQQVKYWNAYYPAIQEFIRLKQMGFSPVSIFQVFEMIKKHQRSLSLDEMISDIDKYGGIKAAMFKQQQDVDEFLESKEVLGLGEGYINLKIFQNSL